MSLTKKEWLLALFIPLALLFVEFVLPKAMELFKREKLLLENIIIVSGNGWVNEFGSWKAHTVSDESIEFDYFKKESPMIPLSNAGYITNDLGVSNYYLEWIPSKKLESALKRFYELQGDFSEFAAILKKHNLSLEKNPEYLVSVGDTYHLASMIAKAAEVPTIRFQMRNLGTKDVVLYGFYIEPIHSMSGGCGAGGEEIQVANSSTVIEISWDITEEYVWSNPISLAANDQTLLEMKPHVISDSPEDCAGPLTYNVSLLYSFGDGKKKLPLATFSQKAENDGLLIFDLDPKYL
ncbi:hypothetical protein ACXAAV_11975 [Vibrio coralliilyticus]